jgi:hypothetical protein
MSLRSKLVPILLLLFAQAHAQTTPSTFDISVSTLNVEENKDWAEQANIIRLRNLAARVEQSLGSANWGLIGLQELLSNRACLGDVTPQPVCLSGYTLIPHPLKCGPNNDWILPADCLRQAMQQASVMAQFGENGYLGSSARVRLVPASGKSLTFAATQAGGINRHVMGARFEIVGTNLILPFYSVHTSNAKNGQERPRKELEEMMKAIHKWQQPGDLTPVLVGDFNCAQLSGRGRQVIYEHFYPASQDVNVVDVIWVGRPQVFPGSAGALRRIVPSTYDSSLKRDGLTDHNLVTSVLHYDSSTSNDAIPVPPLIHDHGCFTELSTFKIHGYGFQPAIGGYDLNWGGPPRRDLTWADVKKYVPTFNFTQKADRIHVNANFYVMERRAVSDTKLGILKVTFLPSTDPRGVLYTYESKEGSSVLPVGAQGAINDGFWLGCTKGGKVRGNYGHGDDRRADVYLKLYWASDHYRLQIPEESHVHRLNCL